ncbi:putative monooxygenase [Chiua virens]|nr:putative monooxygenase [Chiua virens]
MSPPVENYVDVLIIGAGPAGLMCANALAVAGVNVKIIDKLATRVTVGQADGIQPRTTEVFQSYGLAERLLREGNHMHMGAFYHPTPEGGIKCAGRVPDISASSARYPFGLTLQQGGIEAIFLDSMKDHGLQVGRPRQPSAIEISEDPKELSSLSSYPVKVTIECLDAVDDENKTEIVHAKFVVGADGAHSWVRKTLGIEMEGEQTDYIWGVVDMVPDTNFPDIRNHAVVNSRSGSSIVIPREGDTVRIYIQLSNADVLDPLTGRADKSRVNPEKLVSVAKKIFHPFELEPKFIEWWTVYIIGQRVASSYSVKDRVFIAGDACHTHSPKAGQGMNASMNDTHNLAWKLAQVLKGWSSPSLLMTYEHERRKYAQDLIDFDKKVAAFLSKRPPVNGGGAPPGPGGPAFAAKKVYAGFVTGIGVRYSSSAIVDLKPQVYAKNIVVGERMLPQAFVCAADIRPVDIHDMLPADLRFKVLFFVGHLTETKVSELDTLAEELSKPTSFLHKYSADGNISTVFDIITITSGTKETINYLTVPAIFRPHWSKVLLDDADVTGSQGGDGYEKLGIDPDQITIVVVRPDGYVGIIVPSSAVGDLENYFGSFMISCSPVS